MQESPYTGMLEEIRADGQDHASPYPWRLGEILSTEPIVVSIGGIQLKDNDLLINQQLIKHEEGIQLNKIVGEFFGETDCKSCDMTKMTVDDGTLDAEATHAGILEVGDQVVLLQTQDTQQYIVLCKVVNV